MSVDEALLLPGSAGVVSCAMLDPWKQQVLSQQLPAFWRVISSAGSFIIVSLLLTVFALVYIVSTFTVCQCARSRRLLRLCDIRRDTHKKFGAFGTSTQSAPSTAGGCSLVLILSFALLKTVLDVAAGQDPSACTVSRFPAPSTLGARAPIMSSNFGVPEELGYTHATYFFYFQFLDEDGNAANSSWSVAHSKAAVAHSQAVAQEWWEKHGRQHFPARWRDDINSKIHFANGAAIVEVYTPVTTGFTLFGDVKGPSNQPLYALSNDCLDIALMKRQSPRFAGFGRCTSVVKYATAAYQGAGSLGPKWFSNQMQAQFASPKPVDIITSASDTDMNVRAFFTKDVSFCSSVGFYAGSPFDYGNGTLSAGLFSQLNLELVLKSNQISSVATDMTCTSGMTLPTTRLPQQLQSRLYRPTMSTAPIAFTEKGYPAAILPDPELDVFPACAYAQGGASDVVQRSVGAAQDSPLRSTLGNVTYMSAADLAYTPGGVHRHYVGIPAGSGTLRSTVFNLNIVCPSLTSTVMGSLSGIGGLLVFHPFLRLFLLHFRKRTGMPSAARQMAAARAIRLSLGDARAAGRGALSNVRQIQANQASGCLRTAKNGGISLHPTIRAIVTGTVVFVFLSVGSVISYLAAMSTISSSALGLEAAQLAIVVTISLFGLSLTFVAVYGSVNVVLLCGPALRSLLVSKEASASAKVVMSVLSGGLLVWCMIVLARSSSTSAESKGATTNVTTVGGSIKLVVSLFASSLVCVCGASPCILCFRQRCRRLLLSPSDFESSRRDSDDDGPDSEVPELEDGTRKDQGAQAAGLPVDEKEARFRADGGLGASRRSNRDESVGGNSHRQPKAGMGTAPPAATVPGSSDGRSRGKQDSCCLRLKVVCCRGGRLSTLWRGTLRGTQDSPFTMNPASSPSHVQLSDYNR